LVGAASLDPITVLSLIFSRNPQERIERQKGNAADDLHRWISRITLDKRGSRSRSLPARHADGASSAVRG
jgi:hypothetical protein